MQEIQDAADYLSQGLRISGELSQGFPRWFKLWFQRPSYQFARYFKQRSLLRIPQSSIWNERYASLIIISITSYRLPLVTNSPQDLLFASESGSMAAPWNLRLRWSNIRGCGTSYSCHATKTAVERACSASSGLDMRYAKGVVFDESQQDLSSIISHVSKRRGKGCVDQDTGTLGNRENIQDTYQFGPYFRQEEKT